MLNTMQDIPQHVQPKRVLLFGIAIDIGTRRHARERLAELFVDGKQHLLATPNPEMLLAARKNQRLSDALNASDLNMPDGVGVLIALKFRGFLGERYPGVELAEDILRMAQATNETVYFLGDGQGSAEKAAMQLPYMQIVAEAGPDFKKGEQAVTDFSNDLIARINAVKPSVVFAGFGHGKQEVWLHKHLADMPSVKIAIGVGGTFDFWSGVAHRAPKLFRTLGMEWFWRLCMEPKRWKRILNAVVVFPLRVLFSRD